MGAKKANKKTPLNKYMNVVLPRNRLNMAKGANRLFRKMTSLTRSGFSCSGCIALVAIAREKRSNNDTDQKRQPDRSYGIFLDQFLSVFPRFFAFVTGIA